MALADRLLDHNRIFKLTVQIWLPIEEGVLTAKNVSRAFVEQYFQIIAQSPEQARKLYVDASVVTRPKPDGTMISFKSVEAINEHFLGWGPIDETGNPSEEHSEEHEQKEVE